MPSIGNTPRPAYVYDTETDTWVPIGVGAHTHDYIPNTLVDAKGDILTATADNVPARLAKGADGTVLVSDSTTSTGLAWQPYAAPFVAGKNKIINGDFSIWQRGSTFNNPVFSAYAADRWRNQNYDNAPNTWSITREAFTPGAAPVSGYEANYFFRSTITTVGSNTIYDTCSQRIEGLFASGQPITLSFWAKSDISRTQKIFLAQHYGSGGSGDAAIISLTNFSTTSAWQRFTFTATVPSATGKTIGASPYVYLLFRQASASGSVLDVWGVQVEYGSVATPFTTATGTIQGELAACQRYYYRSIGNTTSGGHGAFCATQSTTSAYCYMPLPVTMRTSPTSIDYSGVRLVNYGVAAYGISSLTLSATESSQNCAVFIADGASGMTANRPVFIYNSAATNYIGFSAEL